MALDRSARMPLRIEVFSMVPIIQSILEVILFHASHLEHLAIHSPTHIGSYAPVSDDILSESPSLPMLKTLDLPSRWHSPGTNDGNSRILPAIDMELAPSISLFEYLLTARHLRGLRADMRMLHVFARNQLSFTWSQINTLHLEDVTLTPTFLSIIRCATNLRLLDLTLVGTPEVAEPQPPVVLSCLETLKVSMNRQGSEAFLDWINAPNLETLDLYRDALVTHAILVQHGQDPPINVWQVQHLVKFLGRSQPALSTLSISNLRVPANTLIDIFFTTGRSLRELHLEETGEVTGRLLELLTLDPMNPSSIEVLPLLEVFGLKERSSQTPRSLSTMIGSRCLLEEWNHAAVPLKRVTARTTIYVEPFICGRHVMSGS